MPYQLPECFVQLPVADDDEFDRWEHVRDDYRICIARYYDGETCYYWIGPVADDVPNVYSGEWSEAANLEQASKQAWSAFCLLGVMDRHFGPAVD